MKKIITELNQALLLLGSATRNTDVDIEVKIANESISMNKSVINIFTYAVSSKRRFSHLSTEKEGIADVVFLQPNTIGSASLMGKYESVVNVGLDITLPLSGLIEKMVEIGELSFIPNSVLLVFNTYCSFTPNKPIDKWMLFFLSNKQRRKIQSLLDKKNSN